MSSNSSVKQHVGKKLTFSFQDHLVDIVRGIKIEIFSNEHPPIHFRVKLGASEANYTLTDCTLLNHSGDFKKFKHKIKKWFDEVDDNGNQVNKNKLIKKWNDTRPLNCPVGLYKE